MDPVRGPIGKTSQQGLDYANKQYIASGAAVPTPDRRRAIVLRTIGRRLVVCRHANPQSGPPRLNWMAGATVRQNPALQKLHKHPNGVDHRVSARTDNR